MFRYILLAIATTLAIGPVFAADAPAGDAVTVTAKWDTVARVSDTVPTTQHLANAFTLRSSPLNKPLLKALRDLNTNYTRLQLWFSVPNQAIAELKAPTATQTFWDFQYMDPVVEDFFANTKGIHHINIGTIPRWMFNVPDIDLPIDPAASSYKYTEGTTGELLKDQTGKQVAEFQARLFQWYTQGGFTDELGKRHESGHHYKIDIWGILNEPALENKISVELYTKIFDATAEAIHKIDPTVQFMGPEIVGVQHVIPFARYFLDPKNHSPSAPPVTWFSFHNYVMAPNNPAAWQSAYFNDPMGRFGAPAKAFADQIREVIKVRDELSPKTKIGIDELGTFTMVGPKDHPAETDQPYSAYNPLYWVAAGGNWAANFITAQNLGIPLISMTQMVGAPTQSESCSMINWDTAHPNAHYRVLELINDNFGPGDKLYASESSSPDVVAQASATESAQKLLLVNTSNRTVPVNLAGAFKGSQLKVAVVDEASGEQPARNETIKGFEVKLAPFATAVVSAAP